jgi:serine/threonine protein kinase
MSDTFGRIPDPDETLGSPFPPRPEGSSTPLQEGPGSLIGPYRLIGRIGEGGFGTVFLAEQERPVARRVALKIIKLGMDTRQVVASERGGGSSRDGPPQHRARRGRRRDRLTPVFRDGLRRGDPSRSTATEQPSVTRLDLFAQVCNAVQHAHDEDHPPRHQALNVLVSAHDGKPHAKVTLRDARRPPARSREVDHPASDLIGSPEYMSPEQAEAPDIDTRTDRVQSACCSTSS